MPLTQEVVDDLTQWLLNGDWHNHEIMYVILTWNNEDLAGELEERYFSFNGWRKCLIAGGFSEVEVDSHIQKFPMKGFAHNIGPETKTMEYNPKYKQTFKKLLNAPGFGLFLSGRHKPKPEDWGVLIGYFDNEAFLKEIKRRIWKTWRICNPDLQADESGGGHEFFEQLDDQVQLKKNLLKHVTSMYGHLEAIRKDFDYLRAINSGLGDSESSAYAHNVLSALHTVWPRIPDIVRIAGKTNFPESMIPILQSMQRDLRLAEIKKSDSPVVDYVAKEFTVLFDMCSELSRTGMKFKKYTAERNRFLSEVLSHFGLAKGERTVRSLGNDDNPVPIWLKEKLQKIG